MNWLISTRQSASYLLQADEYEQAWSKPHSDSSAEILLELIWDTLIEVFVSLIPSGLVGHPAKALGDAPHMSVDRELVGAQAEHQNTSNCLATHALEPAYQLQVADSAMVALVDARSVCDGKMMPHSCQPSTTAKTDKLELPEK